MTLFFEVITADPLTLPVPRDALTFDGAGVECSLKEVKEAPQTMENFLPKGQREENTKW